MSSHNRDDPQVFIVTFDQSEIVYCPESNTIVSLLKRATRQAN